MKKIILVAGLFLKLSYTTLQDVSLIAEIFKL